MPSSIALLRKHAVTHTPPRSPVVIVIVSHPLLRPRLAKRRSACNILMS